MSAWSETPTWTDTSTINNGNEYAPGDGIYYSDLNTLVNDVKHVYQCLNTKIDKVNSSQRIYGTDSNGNQEMFSWSTSSSASYAFPKRVDGRLPGILDPVNDEDAANKRYVDTGLSAKIDKVTQGGGIRVPTSQPDGSQWFLQVTSEKTGGTAVMRNSAGQAKFGEPTDNDHAATKKYVDDAIDTLFSNQIGSARVGICSIN